MGHKVNVLLSVYMPEPVYLEKQLISLDNQTYEDMEIIIFDDCVEHRCDLKIFEKYLCRKEYRILPYKEKNLGYTKAFEYLVSESNGDYLAFCDQDDIWDTDKIMRCVETLQKDGSSLVATDRRLIDENDKVFCESVRHSSNKIYETWNTGDDIATYNFFTTCAIGMSMVVDGIFARSCIPFSVNTGHDKWMIACACATNGVSYLDEVLISYRRHKNNVSGVMNGISSKKDYEKKRVIPHLKLIKEFKRKYPEYDVHDAYEFAVARKKHNIIKLIKYRKLAPDIAKFEVVLAILPGFMVKYLIELTRKIA